VLDQVIQHRLERQAFGLAVHQPVPEHDQQRGIERRLPWPQVQSESPALVVLHGLSRLPVWHPQHEL